MATASSTPTKTESVTRLKTQGVPKPMHAITTKKQQTTTEAACSVDVKMKASDESSSPYTLTVEAHAADIIPGQTTYRIYQNLVNADDFFSSVFGNNDDPFSLATTTGFYNSAFGGTTAGDINPSIPVFLPRVRS